MRTLFLVLINLSAYSQNLVPNAGFEEYLNCPIAFMQSTDACPIKNWYSPTLATPDYFNACGSLITSVPNNAAGVAEAHSGKAYLGLALFVDAAYNYTEYVQAKLLQPLIKDSVYCLSFYYRLSSYSMLGCNGIGMYLSSQNLSANNDHAFEFKPQIIDSLMPSENDAQQWIKLQGVYKAIGNEQYITIGKFNGHLENMICKKLFLPERKESRNTAYYFLDDVNVMMLNTSNYYSCAETSLKFK
jgi:OOP family OmpA-OmpF porin